MFHKLIEESVNKQHVKAQLNWAQQREEEVPVHPRCCKDKIIQLRQQLLQMVFELNISVYAASQTLDIQYSTAKHIIRRQRTKIAKIKSSPVQKKPEKKKDTP